MLTVVAASVFYIATQSNPEVRRMKQMTIDSVVNLYRSSLPRVKGETFNAALDKRYRYRQHDRQRMYSWTAKCMQQLRSAVYLNFVRCDVEVCDTNNTRIFRDYLLLL